MLWQDSPRMPTPPRAERLPRQIWFLAWNEAAERFSYYGMSSILVLHMVRNLGLAEHQAVAGKSLFNAAVYLTPLLGALLADVFWGRYRTILWLSFGYVAGHAVLALWESPLGVLVGLALIAAGAGGIKPCASAFAADQVPAAEQRVVERVYNLYYWMINLGSFASTLIIPKVFDLQGPRLAFGIPGIAMGLALLIFLAGRRRYLRVPPARQRGGGARTGPGLAASLRAAGWIALVFAPVSVFWALYFQYDSAWTLQADKMDRLVAGMQVSAGQMTTLNAILILTLIPVFTLGVYPGVARLGLRVTPLRKMSVGMFITVLSFLAAALVEARVQAGLRPSVLAQVPQYLFMGFGEVLVSVTALEFAYTQAPRAMKSFIMGLWFLTISGGSLLAAAVAWLNRFTGASYYTFYAWLMLGAAVIFAVIAWRYRYAAPEESTP
jgi:POT family proton-dependent oligopeptide transporter